MPVIPDLKKNVKEMKIFFILREFYILAISDWLRETMAIQTFRNDFIFN